MKLSQASIALLLVQLALISSIGAKYLYQRSTCPKAWTRAVALDPQLVMRGRYLSVRLRIDACEVLLPPQVKNAVLGRSSTTFKVDGEYREALNGVIAETDGRLIVQRLQTDKELHLGEPFIIPTHQDCSEAMLESPVNFYISDTAKHPYPLAPGSELWVEVTVPPKGPPRPIALATKDSGGGWHPLSYQ